MSSKLKASEETKTGRPPSRPSPWRRALFAFGTAGAVALAAIASASPPDAGADTDYHRCETPSHGGVPSEGFHCDIRRDEQGRRAIFLYAGGEIRGEILLLRSRPGGPELRVCDIEPDGAGIRAHVQEAPSGETHVYRAPKENGYCSRERITFPIRQFRGVWVGHYRTQWVSELSPGPNDPLPM